MIKLYNSLSRKVEEFKPIDPTRVTMYACGPTVYGRAHIGNARPAVVFDTLSRVLRHEYGEHNVLYTTNLTDIDDKIIKGASEAGVDIARFTDKHINDYFNDMGALGAASADQRLRATSYVSDMISMISSLLAKGHAYIVDGEVFFHVPSNPYPGIANHGDDSLQSGEHRVEADSKKKDPRDFVLWKPSKPNEPSWDSPWSKGRPGWHIECSAMIESSIGTTIDIHAGGQDLRFPHHEAEMAQSQCAHDGAPLANYWVHNGMITIDGQKMSKSLNNVVTVDDLLKRYPGESVRYLLMLTHYRSPLNYTKSALNNAHRALNSLYDVLYEYVNVEPKKVDIPDSMMDKLKQDLNTPGALSVLHLISRQLRERDDKALYKGQLLAAGRLMGLLDYDPVSWMTTGVDKEKIEALIAERDTARTNRDWKEADRIRDQLAQMGITLADGVHGTSWRKT